MTCERALIIELAAQHSLLVMYPFRDYEELGGLIAYSPSFVELAKRLEAVVQQALAGDIPYYLTTKFELVVNVKQLKPCRRPLTLRYGGRVRSH